MMDRNAIVQELSTDQKYSHLFEGPNASGGVVTLAERKNGKVRMGGYHYLLPDIFLPNEPQHERVCRLLIRMYHETKVEVRTSGGFLGFGRKREEVTTKQVKRLELVLVYQKRVGRWSCAGYGVSVPSEDSDRIKMAVLSDPSILIDVFARVFTKEFEKETRAGKLTLDQNWANRVVTKEYAEKN